MGGDPAHVILRDTRRAPDRAGLASAARTSQRAAMSDAAQPVDTATAAAPAEGACEPVETMTCVGGGSAASRHAARRTVAFARGWLCALGWLRAARRRARRPLRDGARLLVAVERATPRTVASGCPLRSSAPPGGAHRWAALARAARCRRSRN